MFKAWNTIRYQLVIDYFKIVKSKLLILQVNGF